MLQITCPWCGPRDEREFAYGGESQITRPDPATATDAEWADYLYVRDNIKGPQRERWCHRAGCGQWFLVLRDTLSHEIRAGHGQPPVTEPGP